MSYKKISLTKTIFTLLLFISFLILKNAHSQIIKEEKKSIKIEGEPEGADVSDIPLSPFEYDFDTFNTGFKPEIELINLLDRPEELTGITEKDITLDFDMKK